MLMEDGVEGAFVLARNFLSTQELIHPQDEFITMGSRKIQPCSGDGLGSPRMAGRHFFFFFLFFVFRLPRLARWGGVGCP